MAHELAFLTLPYVDNGRLEWSVCNQGDAPAPAFTVIGTYGVWDEQGTEYKGKTDYQTGFEIPPGESSDASVDLVPLVLMPGIYDGAVELQAPWHSIEVAKFEVKANGEIVGRSS